MPTDRNEGQYCAAERVASGTGAGAVDACNEDTNASPLRDAFAAGPVVIEPARAQLHPPVNERTIGMFDYLAESVLIAFTLGAILGSVVAVHLQARSRRAAISLRRDLRRARRPVAQRVRVRDD